MTTYRAAYIEPEFGSNGVGVVLTRPDQATLSDDDLIAAAMECADECGVEGEIVIGEWTD